MKKKYLNTLIAVLVLAASWGAVTYFNKHSSKTSKDESSKEEKIFSLDSKHITAISFHPRDGEAFTAQREGDSWVISKPRKLPADQGMLSTVLNNLTTAMVEEVVATNASDTKEFGLNPSAYSLEISTDTNPSKITLMLGDDTPTSSGIYAQVAGSTRVVTLPNYVKSSLEKKLFDLRDRHALTLDADQLQKIDVDSKGKRWTLAKNPEGVWNLVLPPPVRADRFAVDGLISQLRALTMQSVVAEDKKNQAAYGFGSPVLYLKLTSPAGTQTITLGKKDKEGERYFAVNSAIEPIFTLNLTLLNEFQKDPAVLRSKDLFSTSSGANRIEVDSPKGHWAFELQKDQWKQTEGGTKTPATDKMENLLTRLQNLRASSFPKGSDLSQFELTKPDYRFSIRSGEKNQVETLEVSKKGDHVYARMATDPLPCELVKTDLDELEKALGEL